MTYWASGGSYAGPRIVVQQQRPQIDASRAVLWLPASTAHDGIACRNPPIYWAPHERCPRGEGVIAYSTEDKPEFAYEAFNEGREFGPLDIARTVMWRRAICIRLKFSSLKCDHLRKSNVRPCVK